MQAKSGDIVTNLHHSSVQFDEPIPLILLQNADGRHSIDDLFELLRESFARREFGLMNEDNSVLEMGDKVDEILTIALENCLKQFVIYALLE